VVEACSCPNFDGFVEVFGFICPSQNLPFSTLLFPNEPSPLFEWRFFGTFASGQKYRKNKLKKSAKNEKKIPTAVVWWSGLVCCATTRVCF